MRQITVAAGAVASALVLRLSGEVTQATAAETSWGLLDATAAAPPPSLVVLDLRDLDTLSASGYSTLRMFAQARAERGIRCRLLVRPDTAVARVLDVVDADAALPRFTDLQDALAEPRVVTAQVTTPAYGGATTIGADEDDALISQFESLTRVLLGATTVGAALRQVVTAAGIVVANSDLVSVTLRTADGRYHTPVTTGPLAEELDRVQYASGAGPCLDAAHPDGPAYAASDDLHAERRWPEFTAAAVSQGYDALISMALVPAAGPARLSGALNIYSRRGHGLTTADRHAALLLATHASLALAHARSAELADLQLAQFRQAVDSRDVIGQAKGILMHRQGITADEAFTLLRHTSQDLNVKLVDLARTITTRHDQLDQP